MKIRNTNIVPISIRDALRGEMRNKYKMTKRNDHLKFGNSNLFRVSDLVLRIY